MSGPRCFRPVSPEDKARIREQYYAGIPTPEEEKASGSWYPDMTLPEQAEWAALHGVPFREPPS